MKVSEYQAPVLNIPRPVKLDLVLEVVPLLNCVGEPASLAHPCKVFIREGGKIEQQQFGRER